MRYKHLLGGCTPTPLAHYLKALGVLRLVAEQKDPEAAGCWQGETFVLKSFLSYDQIEAFFLDEYRPTPIVAPWNGGSGFYFQEEKLSIKDPLTGKRQKTGVRNQPTEATKTVSRLRSSKTDRLELYRRVLSASHEVVKKIGLLEAPKEEEKQRFIVLLRGQFPDESLHWLDSAVLLGSSRMDFPPLLGTGGNDGNLDFTNNFMQRLIDVFRPDDGRPQVESSAWLRNALSGQAISGLLCRAVGQFYPGSVGGPNATVGFETGSLVNPWDYIFMLEGALLFAGSTTRRMEASHEAALSCPFSVRTTRAGSGALGKEPKTRDEIWLPLWRSDATLPELQALFNEGRATLGRRAVRDGLDFVRAISSYGVDRGIAAFQRVGFLMRSGKNFLATPLGKVQVHRVLDVDLLVQLDRFHWLDRLRLFARSEGASGRFQQLIRQLEDAVFALVRFGGRRELQRILVLLGLVQQVCTVSAKGREAVPPMPLLGPKWVVQADDLSHEFRIACALAGLRDMRRYVLPLGEEKGRVVWDPGSHRAVWRNDSLVSNLVRVMNRRMVEAQRFPKELGATHLLEDCCATDLAAVTAFLREETDDDRIAALFAGLVNADLPHSLPERHVPFETPPSGYTLLKPFFTPDKTLRRIGVLSGDGHLPIPVELAPLLKTGQAHQIERAFAIAWRRLNASQVRLPRSPRRPPSLIRIDGRRLMAALMIPVATGELARVFHCLKSASGPSHDFMKGGSNHVS